MADNFIRREVTITVSGKTASLSEPIYLYPRDRYIDIFFTIKDAGFKFGSSQSYGDNASYARIKYIRKDGTREGVVSPSILPVVEGKVKLEITDDFMTKDGVEIEPGVYLLQILLYDNDKGHGRVTIPPVEFEILAPIFKDKEGTDNEGALFSLDVIEVDE